MACDCQQKARQLIERWYKEYIWAAANWAKDRPGPWHDMAIAKVECMHDLSQELDLPEHKELTGELWAVLRKVGEN